MNAGAAAAGLPKVLASAPAACSLPASPLLNDVRGHGAGARARPWCGPLGGQVFGQVPGQAPGRGDIPLHSPFPGQAPAAGSASLGEQFARALNEQGGDDETAPPPEAGAPSGLLPWPPAPTLLAPGAAAAAPGAPPAAVPARAAPDAVSAVASAAPIAAAAPLTLAPADIGQAWELSLHEPDGGLVLSLRAERVAASSLLTASAQPAWSLAISAPVAEAAALQRLAPRLAERLAARALAPAHLRIAAEHEPHPD
jgi:hypothetical protein